MNSQNQAPPSLSPPARCCGCGSNDTSLVLTLNILSRPRAGSRWPEPNGLLAMPRENQTLLCERVLRQETSIVPVFGIGTTELFLLNRSSSAQLPLQSCVELFSRTSSADRAGFWRSLYLRSLRSSRRSPLLEGSGTTFRLKCRITNVAEVGTASLYARLDSEEP